MDMLGAKNEIIGVKALGGKSVPRGVEKVDRAT